MYPANKFIWTDERILFLKENYPKHSAYFCAKKLHVSSPTVIKFIRELGLLDPLKRPRDSGAYKDIAGHVWSNIINNAETRNLLFNIKIEDIWNLYIKQERKCAETGWAILFDLEKGKTTASLDRVDSTKGYTIDNIQLVHKLVNRSKWDLSEKTFYKLCKAVKENRSKDFEYDDEYSEEIDEWNDTIIVKSRLKSKEYSESDLF